jgi:hypothetical protein
MSMTVSNRGTDTHPSANEADQREFTEGGHFFRTFLLAFRLQSVFARDCDFVIYVVELAHEVSGKRRSDDADLECGHEDLSGAVRSREILHLHDIGRILSILPW